MAENWLKIKIQVFKGEELISEIEELSNDDVLELKEWAYILPMNINELWERLSSNIFKWGKQKK